MVPRAYGTVFCVVPVELGVRPNEKQKRLQCVGLMDGKHVPRRPKGEAAAQLGVTEPRVQRRQRGKKLWRGHPQVGRVAFAGVAVTPCDAAAGAFARTDDVEFVPTAQAREQASTTGRGVQEFDDASRTGQSAPRRRLPTARQAWMHSGAKGRTRPSTTRQFRTAQRGMCACLAAGQGACRGAHSRRAPRCRSQQSRRDRDAGRVQSHRVPPFARSRRRRHHELRQCLPAVSSLTLRWAPPSQAVCLNARSGQRCGPR